MRRSRATRRLTGSRTPSCSSASCGSAHGWPSPHASRRSFTVAIALSASWSSGPSPACTPPGRHRPARAASALILRMGACKSLDSWANSSSVRAIARHPDGGALGARHQLFQVAELGEMSAVAVVPACRVAAVADCSAACETRRWRVTCASCRHSVVRSRDHGLLEAVSHRVEGVTDTVGETLERLAAVDEARGGEHERDCDTHCGADQRVDGSPPSVLSCVAATAPSTTRTLTGTWVAAHCGIRKSSSAIANDPATRRPTVSPFRLNRVADREGDQHTQHDRHAAQHRSRDRGPHRHPHGDERRQRREDRVGDVGDQVGEGPGQTGCETRFEDNPDLRRRRRRPRRHLREAIPGARKASLSGSRSQPTCRDLVARGRGRGGDPLAFSDGTQGLHRSRDRPRLRGGRALPPGSVAPPRAVGGERRGRRRLARGMRRRQQHSVPRPARRRDPTPPRRARRVRPDDFWCAVERRHGRGGPLHGAER